MIHKLAYLSLILSLSACVTTGTTAPIPPEQMLLGTWTCSTESGRVRGSTEYKSDGTFFGNNRFTLSPDEDGIQTTLYLNVEGEWRIESNVTITTIVNVRVINVERPGEPMTGNEQDAFRQSYEKWLVSAIMDDPTSHSDIVVLTNEQFATVDQERGGMTTCSRKHQAS